MHTWVYILVPVPVHVPPGILGPSFSLFPAPSSHTDIMRLGSVSWPAVEILFLGWVFPPPAPSPLHHHLICVGILKLFCVSCVWGADFPCFLPTQTTGYLPCPPCRAVLLGLLWHLPFSLPRRVDALWGKVVDVLAQPYRCVAATSGKSMHRSVSFKNFLFTAILTEKQQLSLCCKSTELAITLL